jgi:ABC superfamily ATP binding cassette transporter, binding protein
MKKRFGVALVLSMAMVLGACGAKQQAESAKGTEQKGTEASTAAKEESKEADSKADTGNGKTYKVGILKFMDHPSLNQIEDSLCEELDSLSESSGAKYEYKEYRLNGQGDASVLNQMTAQLIADDVDVIVPIATPAIQVVQSQTEGKNIPIVFSAASDPVSAKLVDSMEKPGGNITGTSDFLNTDAIMDLIFAQNPEAKKIGLLYSKSEDSSQQPIAAAKKYLADKGVEVVEKTGTTTDEVSQAVDALIAEKVDAIFTPTDNTIQKAELSFYEKLIKAKIPHYGGADSFALNGAFAGYGVDYVQLGKATADMVDEVLRQGKDTATLPVQTFDNGIATVNTETAEKLGYSLDKIKEAFKPFCTKIVEIQTEKEFKS